MIPASASTLHRRCRLTNDRQRCPLGVPSVWRGLIIWRNTGMERIVGHKDSEKVGLGGREWVDYKEKTNSAGGWLGRFRTSQAAARA
ncbi:hypothetical protein FOPE_06588 [Fonsecaea pedrosoi]|nr:hypothetical protein FOPE_06588 [Fonsecaea pedrosoi]